MDEEITPDNYLEVVASVIEIDPENRTEDQLKRLVAASSHFPFFRFLRQSKSFDVLSVQTEICKSFKKVKLKECQPIVKAGIISVIRHRR